LLLFLVMYLFIYLSEQANKSADENETEQVVSAGSADTVYSPPACNNPLCVGLYSWPYVAVDMLHRRSNFEVRNRRPSRSEDMTHFRSQH